MLDAAGEQHTGEGRDRGAHASRHEEAGTGRPRAVRKAFILQRSLKLRIVLVFVLLALALMMLFWQGAQRVVVLGWREAAKPLLTDYVSHLAADIVVDGSPQVERAQALVARLPVTVDIRGPAVNWSSHPGQTAGWGGEGFGNRVSILSRDSPDGHQIRFGIDRAVFGPHRHGFLIGLSVLLGLTFLAWLYVRHQLSPLDAIGAGAARFGRGDFSRPIPAHHAGRPDELGKLASTVNIMGEDIRQMLDAKRTLLLAISHELRSPLTRARLHTELLPEDDADVRPQRSALMRDLQEMSRLIADLLESERLAGRHAALQREPVALPALVASVCEELRARYPRTAEVHLHADAALPVLQLDAARMRLLMRNLLDNALRHGAPATGVAVAASAVGTPSSSSAASAPPVRCTTPEGKADEHVLPVSEKGFAGASGATEVHGAGSVCEQHEAKPPEVRLCSLPDGGVRIEVRDFGPGVPEDQIPRLAQAFHRPDSARTRRAGGVGLGLYLCRLVAEAHGGRFEVANAHPGLRATVSLGTSLPGDGHRV